MKNKFNEKIEIITETGCWLWNGTLNSKGYGVFRHNNIRNYAHRLAFQLFIGEIPKGKLVCHKCDIRCCVNPEHLFIGSPRDNSLDMVLKGRSKKGIKHWKARLSEKDVIEIKALSKAERYYGKGVELSKKYGVSQNVIYSIWNNVNWKYL